MEIKKIIIMTLAPWCFIFMLIQGCELTGLVTSRVIQLNSQIASPALAQDIEEFTNLTDNEVSALYQKESMMPADTLHIWAGSSPEPVNSLSGSWPTSRVVPLQYVIK
jgi:hypothetical protein